MAIEVCLQHGIMRDRCSPDCKTLQPESKADLIRGRHARWDSYRRAYPRLQVSFLPGLASVKLICLSCLARTTVGVPAHKESSALNAINHLDQLTFGQVESFGDKHKNCRSLS